MLNRLIGSGIPQFNKNITNKFNIKTKNKKIKLDQRRGYQKKTKRTKESFFAENPQEYKEQMLLDIEKMENVTNVEEIPITNQEIENIAEEPPRTNQEIIDDFLAKIQEKAEAFCLRNFVPRSVDDSPKDEKLGVAINLAENSSGPNIIMDSFVKTIISTYYASMEERFSFLTPEAAEKALEVMEKAIEKYENSDYGELDKEGLIKEFNNYLKSGLTKFVKSFLDNR